MNAAAANCSCGCSYTGVEETGIGDGDWAMVAGIGFVGFGAIINAKYRGARVIALGRNAFRMNLAKEMGADVILDRPARRYPVRSSPFRLGTTTESIAKTAGRCYPLAWHVTGR